MSTSDDAGSYKIHHTGVLDLGWDAFGQLRKDLVEKIVRDFPEPRCS